MSIQREQKQTEVERLRGKFDKATVAILADFRGLTVAEDTELRRRFRESGIEYQVVKNTLARLAALQTGMKTVADDFVGTTAVGLAYGDPVPAAKVAAAFAREHTKFVLKGGWLGGRKLAPAEVENLATMPSLPEMRAIFLATLNAPAGNLLAVFNAVGQNMANVLKARADKLEKNG